MVPHVMVNGIPFPPFITQAHMDEIWANFKTEPHDIFVVTFPRSGTTWTEQMVHLLTNNGEQGDQLLTAAVPWLETLPHREGGMAAILEQIKDKRRFTSHLPFNMMPDYSKDKGRYIYVSRNPKDVAVSYFHHDRSKGGYTGTWAEHFELFMTGKLHFGSYFNHVLSWWVASQEADNILFLKYEDMQADHAGAIRQIAAFVNTELSDDLLAKVLEGSSFKTMSTGEKTNFEWIPQQEGVPSHYRKGKVGDWRNQFSEEQSQRLDELYQQKMGGTGLQFDFGGA